MVDCSSISNRQGRFIFIKYFVENFGNIHIFFTRLKYPHTIVKNDNWWYAHPLMLVDTLGSSPVSGNK